MFFVRSSLTVYTLHFFNVSFWISYVIQNCFCFRYMVWKHNRMVPKFSFLPILLVFYMLRIIIIYIWFDFSSIVIMMVIDVCIHYLRLMLKDQLRRYLRMWRVFLPSSDQWPGWDQRNNVMSWDLLHDSSFLRLLVRSLQLVGWNIILVGKDLLQSFWQSVYILV